MEEERMMNVLVLGASGAGKSTLIKAISGTEVMTGVGEGNTQRIQVYESQTWPIRFIDTKGFEYNILKQLQTIHQIKKYTKQQASETDENDPGIQMERMMRAMGQAAPEVKPILEVNADHAIVKTLENSTDEGYISDVSEVLLDQALLVSGAELSSPTDFIKSMNKLIVK